MKSILSISFIFVFALSACSDFLEERQISGISYQYYETEKGIYDAVSAAYSHIRYLYGVKNESTCLTQAGTDIHRMANSNIPLHTYISSLGPEYGYFEELWNDYYKGIQSCNLVCDNIGKVPGEKYLVKDADRANMHAQATFLRAFYYFSLVQSFGKVPLLVHENIGVLQNMKRAEVADIYSQIISDLRYSFNHLYQTQADQGRATKGAAGHLLAKVYLTRGSAVTEARGQKPTDMDSAAYYAEEVLKLNYALERNFEDVFSYENQNKSKEIIFSIQYSTDLSFNNNGNTTHLFYIMVYDQRPGMMRTLQYGRPMAYVRPTEYFYDLWNNNGGSGAVDSRLYKMFQWTWICNNAGNIPKWGDENPSLKGKPKFSVGDTAVYLSLNNNIPDAEIKTKSYSWYPRNKFTQQIFPTYKFHMDPKLADLSDKRGTRDFIVMRLAETYLIAAEAYGRKGNYDKAAEYINTVRRRAAYKDGEAKPAQVYTIDGIPLNTASTEPAMEISTANINSSDKIRDFILEERARELYGENMRWFDLVRTETFYQRVYDYNPDARTNVKATHKLRPIPQNHIDRLMDKGPIEEEQNPGYY